MNDTHDVDDGCSVPRRNAARWLDVPVTEQQVERLFQATNAATHQKKVRRRLGMGLGALAAAIAAATIIALMPAPEGPRDHAAGTGFEMTTTDRPQSALLDDGSSVLAASRSRVVRATGSAGERVYELEAGRAEFDVVHRAGSRFIVWAAGVRVRVLGTRFSVDIVRDERGPTAVEVSVARGRVEVTGPRGETTLLGAGDRVRLDLRAEAEASDIEAPPAAALAEVPPAPRAARPRPPPSPDDLFTEGRESAARGDVRTAVEAYRRFVARYPGDPRASLASFELGRMRMDDLGQLRAAARDLERVHRLAPRSPLADEALARRVRIHHRTGETLECHRLQEEYLQRYPQGRHRADVAGRCR